MPVGVVVVVDDDDDEDEDEDEDDLTNVTLCFIDTQLNITKLYIFTYIDHNECKPCTGLL